MGVKIIVDVKCGCDTMIAGYNEGDNMTTVAIIIIAFMFLEATHRR